MLRICLACLAMRSRFELVLESENSSEAFLQAAGEEALAEIPRAESLLSAYLPGSDLFRINEGAAQHPVRVSADTMRFLEEARRLSQETEGAFDLAVGPLLDLWGISGEVGTVPTDEQIKQALCLVGHDKVVLDTETQSVSFLVPGMRLDPGAIGKGWAIDLAIAVLREMGVTRALLHGGTSTVATIGTWEVSREDGTMITLTDQALSVSAWNGKSFTLPDGMVLGHVIDPRTGYPISSRKQAHFVHASATVTDALSTALLVQDYPMLY